MTIFSSSFGFLSFSANSSLTFGLACGSPSNREPASSGSGSFFFLLEIGGSGVAAILICTAGFKSALLNFFLGSGFSSSSSLSDSDSGFFGKTAGVMTIFSSSFFFLSFSANSSLTFDLAGASNNEPASSGSGSFFFLREIGGSGVAAIFI